MTRVKLKYVTADVDRYGTVRYYFRKRGLTRKTRLPGLPGDQKFMAAYQALLEGRPLPADHSTPRTIAPAQTDSFRWLCQQFFSSHAFKKELDSSTQGRHRSHLEHICNLPVSDANDKVIGDMPFAQMTTKAVRRIHERKADTPAAANNWLKAMKALFKWAVKQEHAAHNPTRDVQKFRLVTEGHHSWTLEEVAAFEACHKIGTTPRLALALLLYTGCRRGDVIALGPQHIKDGYLTYTQQKNRTTSPVTLSLPVLPALAEVIAATRTEHLTFLVNAYGKPFTNAGFGNRFKKWATQAGVPHCTAHGLRKAGASRAAENGATSSQLMAIYGWRDIKHVELYTRKAEQKRLASDSMHLIAGKDRPGTSVSHSDAGFPADGTKTAKTVSKSNT